METVDLVQHQSSNPTEEGMNDRAADPGADPVLRRASATADRDLGPQAPPADDLTRDAGWLLTVLSAVGALWSSWGLFPNDAVGMWAGYWVSGCATIAILGAIRLRGSLPTGPPVTVTAFAGGTLLLLGAVRDYPLAISATMIAGGAGIVLGALMQIRHAADSG